MIRKRIAQKKGILIVIVSLLFLHIFLLVRHINMPNMMYAIDSTQITQKEYGASVQKKEELAKQQAKFSIFTEDSSFTKISSEKERKDYADCKESQSLITPTLRP